MEQKVINLLGIRKKAILARFSGFKGGDVAVIEPLTQDEEDKIDKTSIHTLSNGFQISKENIYFYGDIDINNKDDIKFIINKNLIHDANTIRSNFNYEKGNHKILDQLRCYNTSNPVEWFKYNHCLIGKPAKVIVYKLPKVCL